MIRHRWKDAPCQEISDEAEAALLGCILFDPILIEQAIGITPAAFRTAENAEIWRVVTEMMEEKEVVNHITVGDRCTPPRSLGLLRFGNYAPTEDETAAYARIVREAATRRRLTSLKTNGAA